MEAAIGIYLTGAVWASLLLPLPVFVWLVVDFARGESSKRPDARPPALDDSDSRRAGSLPPGLGVAAWLLPPLVGAAVVAAHIALAFLPRSVDVVLRSMPHNGLVEEALIVACLSIVGLFAIASSLTLLAIRVTTRRRAAAPSSQGGLAPLEHRVLRRLRAATIVGVVAFALAGPVLLWGPLFWAHGVFSLG